MLNFPSKTVKSHTAEYPSSTDLLRALVKATIESGKDSWSRFEDPPSNLIAEVAAEENGLLINLPSLKEKVPEDVLSESSLSVPASWEIAAKRGRGFFFSGYLTFRTTQDDVDTVVDFLDSFFEAKSRSGADYRVYGTLQ